MKKTSPILLSLLGLALAGATGCGARAAEVSSAEVDALRERVAEMEETAGRNRVRMQDMEERIFLLQDRVEANRLSLQRRNTESYEGLRHQYAGTVGGGHYGTPPTAYAPPPFPDIDPMRPELPVETLTPEGEVVAPAETGDEIVYTQSDFEAYVASSGWGQTEAPEEPRPSSSRPSGERRAQPPVVTNGDRLPVVDSSNRVPDVSPDMSPLAVYREGLNLFNAGEYTPALQHMEQFLATGPEADYMDNALFWIGECHYGLGQYAEAMTYFQRVVSDYPDGNKVPDSLLKVALTYERLNDDVHAREVLRVLVDTYPSTEAARRANERLRELQ